MNTNTNKLVSGLEEVAQATGTQIAKDFAALFGAFAQAIPQIEKGGQAALAAAGPFIKSLEALATHGPDSEEWASVIQGIQTNSQIIQQSED